MKIASLDSSIVGRLRKVLARTAFALAGTAALGACSDQGAATESASISPLVDQSAVLGMEDPQLWSAPGLNLGQSSQRVQGSFSLAVPASGWTVVTSVPLSSLGEVGSSTSVSVYLPQSLGWGDVRLIFSSPSRGVHWAELQPASLAGRSAGTFHQLSFPVSASLREALNGEYTDLQVRVVLNVPAAESPYLVDALSFIGGSSGGGGTEGGGADPGGTGGSSSGGESGGATGGSDGGGTPGVGGSLQDPDSGTGGDPGTDGPTGWNQRTISFPLPPLLGVDQIAVLASNGVIVRDRGTVEGSLGTLPATVAMGTSGIVANDARLADLYSRGTVELRHRGLVQGSIFTTGPVVGLETSQVQGSVITDYQFDPPGELSWNVRIPPELIGDLALEPDQHLHLTPGRYGTVSIKSRSSVTLEAGDYFMASLRVLEPQSELRIDDSAGPVRLYVEDNLVFRGAILRAAGAAPADVLVTVLGQSPIYLESAFHGFFFAPNASVEVRRTQAAHSGVVFAHSVDLDADVLWEHRPFRLNQFFPTSLVLDPIDRSGRGVIANSGVADGAVTKAVDLSGRHDCDPELELSSSLTGIQPDTRIQYKQSTSGGRCLAEFATCNDSEQEARRPSEDELNRVPSASEICSGAVSIFPCGVDEETIEWDDDIGLCSDHSDCLLFGKVCAQVCLRAGCAGDADCLEPTCRQDVEFRCAKGRPGCAAQPTSTHCEEIRECAEPNHSGSSDPKQHALTGKPPSNVDAPPAEVPDTPEEIPEPPGEYDSSSRCAAGITPKAPTVVLSPQEDERDIVAGNDKWGLFAKPKIHMHAAANPAALGGDARLNVEGLAELDLGVRIWSNDVSVFFAGGHASFQTCGGEVGRELKFFGFDVDPGGGPDMPALAGECDELLEARAGLATQLRDTMLRTTAVKHAVECLGSPREENAAQYGELCAETRRALLNVNPEIVQLPANCDSPAEQQRVLKAWVDYYRSHRNKIAEDQVAIAQVRNAIRAHLPPETLPFVDIRDRFSAFRYKFNYPVGPVLVIVEIELAGSWGVSGELQTQFQASPIEVGVKAGLRPRFDVTAIAFAGVGIGPVSVGLSGELLLLDLQTPLSSGVTVRAVPVVDIRPLTFPDLPYAFASAIPNVPGFLPFGPTVHEWEADWIYGAGARTELLSGAIDLQARVNMLFFKKKFSVRLARWTGAVKDYAFTGRLVGGNSSGQAVIQPASDQPSFGGFYERTAFVDPDALLTQSLGTTQAEDPVSCEIPDLQPCIVVR